MKLLKNIYQVGGPSVSHFFDATAYLITFQGGLRWPRGFETETAPDMEEGCFLIDCGTPEGYAQIKENIKKTGNDPARVRFILGTHGHYDHVGAAHLWKEEFGCRLYLHQADRQQVEEGDSVKTSAALLYGTRSVPCAVDGCISEGDTWEGEDFSVEAIHTPGHTMGSVSFDVTCNGDRLLIAGDTIWGGFSEKIGSDEAAWSLSLDKLTARHYDFYTFGHVNPQLIADADLRLKEAKMAFANYYNPWFKTFFEKYRY